MLYAPEQIVFKLFVWSRSDMCFMHLMRQIGPHLTGFLWRFACTKLKGRGRWIQLAPKLTHDFGNLAVGVIRRKASCVWLVHKFIVDLRRAVPHISFLCISKDRPEWSIWRSLVFLQLIWIVFWNIHGRILQSRTKKLCKGCMKYMQFANAWLWCPLTTPVLNSNKRDLNNLRTCIIK